MADDTGRAPKKKKKGAAGPGDRTFRRLEEQDAPSAPLPVAWAFGLGLGLLGGLAVMAWDVAVLERAGIPVLPALTTEALLPWVVAHASLGAAIGLLGGCTGLFGARWATATTCAALGWVVAPAAVDVAVSLHLPGVVGLGLAVLLGGVAGQLLGRIPAPAAAHAMFSTTVFSAALVLVPIHQQLLSSSTSAGALALSAIAVALGLPFAAACAVLARDGRPPVVSLLALLSLGAGAAVAFRSRVEPPPLPPGSAAGPSVVLVAVDGLRAGELDALPSLQRLAGRSVAFQGARTTSNWAVPALGSVLTGRWPYGHQAGLHDGTGPAGTPLDPRLPTLAGSLAGLGYATVGITGDPTLRTHGLDQGFAEWLDQPPEGAAPAVAAPLRRAGLVSRSLWSRTAAKVVTERAVASLARGGATLLLVHYPDLRTGQGDVAALDAALEQLVAAVPADAILVVFGTHGRAGTDVRQSVEDAGSDSMFDERIHVPLLVRAPAQGARKVARVVSLVDVPATVAALVGDAGWPAGDGPPLAELSGGEGPVDRVALAQSSGRGQEHQAVVQWPYKLVRSGDHAALYSLERDPTEREPLRIDPALDPIERTMEAALPSDGAPVLRGALPPVGVQVGQLAARVWGSRR